MRRSVEEIRIRCKLIINDLGIISLVEKSSSPTAAYHMILTETNNVEKAKSGRWLAILRRDYL